ncbi:MAG: protein-S-isoprenylcysteine O-methyltransferase [candidate division WOR-3 bacterium]
MINKTINILYILGFIIICIARYVQSRANKMNQLVVFKSSLLDRLLLSLNSFGYIIFPILVMITNYLNFANYRLWIGFKFIGLILYLTAIYIIIKAQIQLNHSWSPWLELYKGHKLVGHGLFKYIRHPIYAAHFLWAFALPLIFHNWIAGFALFVTFLPFYLYRVRREEKMLLEYFPNEYRLYMQRTNRIFPSWWHF